MTDKTNKTDVPMATVQPQEDGTFILIDPVAVGVIRAINKDNCKSTLKMNIDRMAHFEARVSELKRTPADAVIVIIKVDDPNGGPIADALMPNCNWQEIRDRGETPFARGLADREGMQEVLDSIDTEAATKLREMTGLAIVVVDHGVAEIFRA